MRHDFTKHRISTKDKFVSVLRPGSTSYAPPSTKPWYRSRGNFLILLMIMVFFFLLLAVKVIFSVKNETETTTPENETYIEDSTDTETSDEPMDYEEAKRIFQGIN